MGSLSVSLAVIDYIIIAIYLVGTMTIGLVLSKRMKSADDFFLAGRSMIWPFVGLSLFASNISSSTLVGLAGDAYSVGISVFNYEWMAALILIVFAAFFLPIFLRSRVFTMPEFLARRYDGRARTYLSVLTLFLSVAVDTAAGLYAGALVIKLAVPGLLLWQCIAALAIFAGIYTMAGGAPCERRVLRLHRGGGVPGRCRRPDVLLLRRGLVRARLFHQCAPRWTI